jgi:drug/metabolite transporter (DMT)-like permease
MDTATPARAGARTSVDAAATLIMVVLTFTWGFNQVLAKLSTEGFSPLFLTAARSAIGLLVVVLWCRARGIKLFERDGTLKPGLLAGSFFALEFALIFVGLDFTTASRAALMINTMPFFVAVGGHFLLGERLTATMLAGLVAAFAGVALVLSGGGAGASSGVLHHEILGDVLCVLGGAAWGATMLVIKGSRLRTAPGEKTLLYQLLVSSVATLPLLPFAGPVVRDVTWLATASLLFQGVVVVGVTYVVWFSLLRRYPATGLSSFTFLTPVFGVLCGAVALGEPVTWRVVGALGLVVVGLVLVNRVGR